MPDAPRPGSSHATAGTPPLLQLRRALAARPRGPRCELCQVPIAPEAAPGAPGPGAPGLDLGSRGHDHLLAPARREVRCVCAGCARARAEAAPREWVRIRRRVHRLGPLALDPDPFASLGVPVRVVFFARNAAGEARACYPSPAGVTEAPLDPVAWDALTAGRPELAALAPEAEVLLVHALGDARDAWIVSLDLALRLVGLVRRHWRGFTGGREVVVELRRFLAALDVEARLDPAPSP